MVALGLLGAMCVVAGTLYFAPYQLSLPGFWEMRFTAGRLRWMLWTSGALLIAHAAVLSIVQRREVVGSPTLLALWASHERSALLLARVSTPLLAVLYAWLRVRNNVEIPHASLGELVGGQAWAPFQYRALVPWLIAGADRLGLVAGGDLRLAFATVEAISAFLLVAAMERLLKLYFPATRAALLAPAVLIPLVFTLATPVRANAYLYPYDTPAVLFMAVGLWLLLARKWWAFYPLFAVATLNRETTCFLTIMYLLGALRRYAPRTMAAHVTAQAAIWIAIKLALVWLYPSIPIEDRGATPFIEQPLFISMAERNLQFLINPLSYAYVVAALGGTWVALGLYGRLVDPPEVRRALLVAIPFVLAMSYVGLLAEIRVFCELVPLFTLGYVLMLRTFACRAGQCGLVDANIARSVGHGGPPRVATASTA